MDRLRRACGRLILGGFSGPQLSSRTATALRRGERGGAVLFGRNIHDLEQTADLCRSILDAAAGPFLIAVDQEGGRVARLKTPFVALPPMRELGDRDDLVFTAHCGRTVGAQLAALGFNVDFAPVADVDSNPANPVIGDRSFSPSPHRVARHVVAFGQGLQSAGVAACAKHFPGHGDTAVDSHLALPVVDKGADELRAIELVPFIAAIREGLSSIMTAHVVFPPWTGDRPATLTPRIVTTLLRQELGFGGVVFTDDLEMGAVAARGAEAAVEAVAAGCDGLLICSDEDRQAAAFEALVGAAERSASMAERVFEAARRLERLALRYPAHVASVENRARIFAGDDGSPAPR